MVIIYDSKTDLIREGLNKIEAYTPKGLLRSGDLIQMETFVESLQEFGMDENSITKYIPEKFGLAGSKKDYIEKTLRRSERIKNMNKKK